MAVAVVIIVVAAVVAVVIIVMGVALLHIVSLWQSSNPCWVLAAAAVAGIVV